MKKRYSCRETLIFIVARHTSTTNFLPTVMFYVRIFAFL